MKILSACIWKLLLPTLIFICFDASSKEPAQGYFVKDALFRTLSPFFTERLHDSKVEISYCPETPCDVIEYSSQIGDEIKYDFALLYLMTNTSYPEFREKGYRMPSGVDVSSSLVPLIPIVLKKYELIGDCDDKSNREFCVLHYLKRKYNIEISVQVEKG